LISPLQKHPYKSPLCHSVPVFDHTPMEAKTLIVPPKYGYNSYKQQQRDARAIVLQEKETEKKGVGKFAHFNVELHNVLDLLDFPLVLSKIVQEYAHYDAQYEDYCRLLTFAKQSAVVHAMLKWSSSSATHDSNPVVHSSLRTDQEYRAFYNFSQLVWNRVARFRNANWFYNHNYPRANTSGLLKRWMNCGDCCHWLAKAGKFFVLDNGSLVSLVVPTVAELCDSEVFYHYAGFVRKYYEKLDVVFKEVSVRSFRSLEESEKEVMMVVRDRRSHWGGQHFGGLHLCWSRPETLCRSPDGTFCFDLQAEKEGLVW
jgi:hypothetical protein